MNSVKQTQYLSVVREEGAGISQSGLAKLFQPFNCPGAETNVIEGTGPGLIISKQLVELMDSNLGVDSEPERGSTFWIALDLYSTE